MASDPKEAGMRVPSDDIDSGKVAMTDIEKFLWDGLAPSSTPFVGQVGLADSVVSVVVVSGETGGELATLSFSDAAITSIWFDGKEPVQWPLDIVGFDSFPAGERWRFLLNCSSIELGWMSAWPSKVRSVER